MIAGLCNVTVVLSTSMILLHSTCNSHNPTHCVCQLHD